MDEKQRALMQFDEGFKKMVLDTKPEIREQLNLIIQSEQDIKPIENS